MERMAAHWTCACRFIFEPHTEAENTEHMPTGCTDRLYGVLDEGLPEGAGELTEQVKVDLDARAHASIFSTANVTC